MPAKNRNDLKSFFVKNAIPTEGNFADLIDSQLNQAVDGIFKLEGEPLSIVAAASQQKRTLRLYSDYPAANPDWMISLNPAQDPANAATNRPGLGFTDGAGNTRLFIEAGAAGKVGIGTNAPAEKLHVAGRIHATADLLSVGTDAWDAGPNRGALLWGPYGTNNQGALLLSAWTNAGGTARQQEVGIHASRVFFAGNVNVNFTNQLAFIQSPLSVGGSVGIGSGQNPFPAKLSLGMDLNNTKIALHDNPNDLYGFGIQGGQLRIHCGSAGARISFLNAAAGTEVMTILGSGRVGIGVVSPNESLAIAGMGSCIELGAGTTKEVNAGKIAYAKFEPGNNALEIVGGGTSRRITMWAEAGLRLNGSAFVGGNVTVGAGANGVLKTRHIDGKRPDNDQDDPLYLNWGLGRPVVVNRPEQPAGIECYGTLLIRNNAPGAIRIADQSDPNRSFGIYFESGNNTIVFYHHTGQGQFMRADGIWQRNSDASLKENVAELSGLLDKVVQLRPVSFDWKGLPERGIGFIAQDVEPLFPEMVSEHTDKDGKPVKGLPYSNFGVLAIGAIKEMKQRYDERIEALEQQVRELKGLRG